MTGTKHLVLLLAAMLGAMVLIGGVALADTILGTDNPDTLTGTVGDDTIEGYGGNDTIAAMAGSDTVKGGLGDDTLYGGNEAQTVGTNADRERVEGGDGKDVVIGGAGIDELKGGGGNDVLVEGPIGDAAEEKFIAEDGDDQIYTASIPASRDVVQCGNGSDFAQVDGLDDVNNDCETVEVMPQPTATPAPSSVPQSLYAAPPNDEGEITFQATETSDRMDGCVAPGVGRGYRLCAYFDQGVGPGERVDVKVTDSQGNRRLKFNGYSYPGGAFKGGATITPPERKRLVRNITQSNVYDVGVFARSAYSFSNTRINTGRAIHVMP